MYANPYLAKPSLSLIAWLLIFFSGTAFGVPEIEHWTTLKGGRVYYVKTEGLPLVDVRMVFDAGSARDGTLQQIKNNPCLFLENTHLKC